jgi:hypothetical protein
LRIGVPATEPGVEGDAVVAWDAGDGSEDIDQRVHVVRAEAHQIGVACRAVRLAVPELEEQRALEQEVGCVLGDRQPVQQAFQAVPGQGQVEVLLRRVGVLLEPGTDGCGAVRGHWTTVRTACCRMSARERPGALMP